jgi:FAD/FMN-containing dehydrogenase
MHALIRKLEAIVGEHGWLQGPDASAYGRDWLDQYGMPPLGVARPRSGHQVAAVVRACADAGVAIVPQGGNTGLCGGSVSADGAAVIVSLSRMNGIGRVDPVGRCAEVEAGAVLRRVHEATADSCLMFPLRLGSEGSAQIGGLIATNAGGSHALRYGLMQDLVLGLEVVLADGRVWNGMRPVMKDNAGYQLRQLFCGSEGTLGIVTRAVLRLYPMPRQAITALIAVPGMDDALRFAARLRGQAEEFLTGLEFISDTGVGFVLKHIPDLAFPLRIRAPFYLLIECAASSVLVPLEDLWEEVLADAMEEGWVLDGTVAASEQQSRHFWRLREELPEGQRREGLQIKNDISVPVASLGVFLDKAGAAVETVLPGVRINPFGHLADGNVHYNISPPEGQADFVGREDALRLAVARIAQSLGGSFAAEHGLGRSKVFLADMLRPPVERALMRELKHALDPAGSLNPNVVVRAEALSNGKGVTQRPVASAGYHGD